jgi:hypothetical protein
MTAYDGLRGEIRGWGPAFENLQRRKLREGIRVTVRRALWRFGRGRYPFDDTWPFVRAIVDAFTLDRCLWASATCAPTACARTAWCLGCLRAALPITYTDQMCGRFTNRLTWREIVARYRLTMPAVNLQPRYNVAPATNMAAFITGDRGFGRSRSARADAATC